MGSLEERIKEKVRKYENCWRIGRNTISNLV